jgi:hypothetical protein
MAELESETDRGTDQPWSRPGQLAQNPEMVAPTASQRQNEYESGIGQAERSGYQQSSQTSPSANEPVSASNRLRGDGKVGDPLPLLLMAIVLISVAAAIVAAAWFFIR